jgi:hypothetical protein
MTQEHRLPPVPHNPDLPEGPPTLFLDIDGVLHSDDDAAWVDGGPPVGNIFRWNLRFVHAMEEFPDVQVVLHSTWRLLWNTDKELFSYLPESLNALIQGRTTGRAANGRWESIWDYCLTHNIKRFVILDDMKKSFPHDLEQLVWCKPDKGVSKESTMNLLKKKLREII